jgi:hypothetical protein
LTHDSESPPADRQKARKLGARLAEWGVLGAALAASFLLGAWVNRPQPTSLAEQPRPAPEAPETTKVPPQPHSRGGSQPRRPEPQAAEARAAAIRRDAEAIRAECKAAGGDWEKWQRDTAPYREALKGRLASPGKAGSGVAADGLTVMEGLSGFPLFEVSPGMHLRHLYDPDSVDPFRKERPVVAARRWLGARGIDLIFVPVPKMTEVYVEHFLDRCPADGVVGPHLRRTLLELLDNDVEVVDVFRLFRSKRDADEEYLYNSADSHWAPRGMHVVAKELADRIERYRFGSQARYGPPVVKTCPEPYWASLSNSLGGDLPFQDGWISLSDEQRKRAVAAQAAVSLQVTTPDGNRPADHPESPVLVIGHSYLRHFRELLVKELNLLVQTNFGKNNTTEGFADLLRDPELLAHCHVVVWVTTEQHLTRFQPMPPPILAALEEKK